MKRSNRLRRILINMSLGKQGVIYIISSGMNCVIGILKWRSSQFTVKMREKRIQQDLSCLCFRSDNAYAPSVRSEEHTSELQSRFDLVCRLLLEKKNTLVRPLTVLRRADISAAM